MGFGRDLLITVVTEPRTDFRSWSVAIDDTTRAPSTRAAFAERLRGQRVEHGPSVLAEDSV